MYLKQTKKQQTGEAGLDFTMTRRRLEAEGREEKNGKQKRKNLRMHLADDKSELKSQFMGRKAALIGALKALEPRITHFLPLT